MLLVWDMYEEKCEGCINAVGIAECEKEADGDY